MHRPTSPAPTSPWTEAISRCDPSRCDPNRRHTCRRRRAARAPATREELCMRFMTDGLRFPEGPVMLKDGSGVAVVELASAAITAVDFDGSKRQIASTGGSPNGLAWGPDGMLYVCNNGGLNWVEKDGLLRAHGQADDYSGGRIERVDP